MLPNRLLFALVALACAPGGAVGAPVKTAAELVKAVQTASEGDTIEVGEGTFELDAVLELKAKVKLKGAGIDKTTLTHTKDRKHPTKTLPDPEMRLEGLDTDAYLLRLKRDSAGITVSDLTLRAPQLHGAIFGWFNRDLTVERVRVKETMWSGIRTFGTQRAKIRDCEFVDAGGRWSKGEPGAKGGITGGAIFACWMADTEIHDCTFARTRTAPEHEFYGIKVRQAKRCRVHHNTIDANFSLEFPFENDEDNEIDHNVLRGTVSIPKYAGGPVPKSGRTFHIHHNWFTDTYSIEFVRNGVEIDHNLFDFDTKADHGNLIAGFGQAAAKGPAKFHNNLVNNPGRGVIWINEPYSDLEVRNNHIVCRTTKTPRKEGLFGFNPKCDFKTITIRDNVIECIGQERPLFRNAESYGARVANNALTGVSDAQKLENAKGDAKPGLEAPLKFKCGAREAFAVDGWTATPVKK